MERKVAQNNESGNTENIDLSKAREAAADELISGILAAIPVSKRLSGEILNTLVGYTPLQAMVALTALSIGLCRRHGMDDGFVSLLAKMLSEATAEDGTL